jgi:hypothetical protein
VTIPQRRAWAAVGALLAASVGALLLDLGPMVWGAVFVALAVGLATYVGASIAGEEQRHVVDSRTERVAQRSVERSGGSVSAAAMCEVVAAGAGTAGEVAEVLGVFEYIAVKMLSSLALQGRVTQLDGRYVLVAQPSEAEAPSRAAHWIEPTTAAADTES